MLIPWGIDFTYGSWQHRSFLSCPHTTEFFSSMRRNSSIFCDCDHRLDCREQKRDRKPYSAGRTLRQGRALPKKLNDQPRTSGRVEWYVCCVLFRLIVVSCHWGIWLIDQRRSRRSGNHSNCCLMNQIAVIAVRSGQTEGTVHGEAYPDLGVGGVYACPESLIIRFVSGCLEQTWSWLTSASTQSFGRLSFGPCINSNEWFDLRYSYLQAGDDIYIMGHWLNIFSPGGVDGALVRTAWHYQIGGNGLSWLCDTCHATRVVDCSCMTTIHAYQAEESVMRPYSWPWCTFQLRAGSLRINCA